MRSGRRSVRGRRGYPWGEDFLWAAFTLPWRMKRHRRPGCKGLVVQYFVGHFAGVHGALQLMRGAGHSATECVRIHMKKSAALRRDGDHTAVLRRTLRPENER